MSVRAVYGAGNVLIQRSAPATIAGVFNNSVETRQPGLPLLCNQHYSDDKSKFVGNCARFAAQPAEVARRPIHIDIR
jgi:hypothetical protein